MAKSIFDRTALALFKTVPARAAHHLLFLAQSNPDLSDRWGYHVHVHDIFFPYDYPAEWLLNRRLALNEQYLLEAFLAFNHSFTTQLANYWFCLDHPDEAGRLWPNTGASSFWMKRVA